MLSLVLIGTKLECAADARALARALPATLSGRTIERTLALLSRFFNEPIERGHAAALLGRLSLT